MICILHGYLLEGSGSNLWTRAVARSLCRNGETVHLVCQENEPERYEFIAEVHVYHPDGRVETVLQRETPEPGRCILHKPRLGDTLPVYVWDKYDEFANVVPMVELPDAEIEQYLERNTRVVERVVREHGITAIHANHAVLMSVVAERVGKGTGTPFVVMPHGSALEYAVKKDPRMRAYAEDAFRAASRLFVIGREMRERVRGIFDGMPGLEEKMSELNLGVDTGLFEPIPRARRPAAVEGLKRSLQGVERGKRPEQSRAMLDALHGCATEEQITEALGRAMEYEGKAPDAGLEDRLDRVDWEQDEVLLFVGRLIAAKGVQSVLAAMPLILRERPRARLVVVGHGPLREALEALRWALHAGRRDVAEAVVRWGRHLEGRATDPALSEVRALLDGLREQGRLEEFWKAAETLMDEDRVIFTGYLEHRQLCHLFPCCDIAVFPSVVREAGPLVFLEALAAGSFPLGTDFGGMAVSIESVTADLPPEVAACMRLSPDPERTAADIAAQAPRALALEGRYREPLRRVVEQRYDWRSVAAHFSRTLHSLAAAPAQAAGAADAAEDG